MNVIPKYNSGKIINSMITAQTFEETISEIENWIARKESQYVCICNTHSVVTASNDPEFSKVLDNAAICTPDGMPLVWALRKYGFIKQDRVDGPNLMLQLCNLSSIKNYRLFLYGGTEETLEKLQSKLTNDYIGINIVGSYSPPFRMLTQEEDMQICELINSVKADVIFVSLGCPKQEFWMYEHKNSINGVMIGVGAAFEFLTGKIKRPPLIFQRIGLEWLFRLISEPKRLWRRYAYNNPIYIYRFLRTYNKNKKQIIRAQQIGSINKN